MIDRLKAAAISIAALVMRQPFEEKLEVAGRYRAECRDADGNLKWVEEFDNLVTTVGKNHILDTLFRGSGYTQTMRMGLKGAGSAAAGDTQASHVGWSELTDYTGNRPSITFNAASSGSITHTAQAFAITGTMTVAGVFMNNGGSATKGDTTGTLYSAGDFSVSRSVVNGDTLNVTYTASV